ncbi:MAG: GGDEF domain-containing protein [Lawsonibacter sp.]
MAEEKYEIHLFCTDGQWRGTIDGPKGTSAFLGIGDLLEQLNIDSTSQLSHLRRLAQTDPLTGLLNRRGLEEEVEKAQAKGIRHMALLLLDIDDLKQINDTWGHRMGDVALCKVAEILKQASNSESLVGRIGGDEFVVVYWGLVDEIDLQEKGEQICQMVARLKSEIGLSVSIGASYGHEYKELLEQADVALYRVKRSGKRGVCLDRVLNQSRMENI